VQNDVEICGNFAGLTWDGVIAGRDALEQRLDLVVGPGSKVKKIAH
jgi:hypothetical protein